MIIIPPLINLVGQRFGKLVVLQKADIKINNRPAWICQCDCGNIKTVNGNRLRLGETKSCGCLVKENGKKNKVEMPIGSKWGQWTILEEIPQRKNNYVYYKCQCSCGNIKEVSGHSLRSGESTSCGLCLRNNIIGKKFGLLTIKNINQERTDNKNIYVDCLCDCGNLTTIMYGNLVRKENAVKSCGCIGKSYGEHKVAQLLSDFKIPYEQQKTFETCRFIDTNKKGIFDFYVDNQYIIEVDGKQHFYKSCEFYEGGFEKTRQSDLYKNNWCRENNIPIIRIPFNKIDQLTIEDLKLETTPFILKGDDDYFSQLQTTPSH